MTTATVICVAESFGENENGAGHATRKSIQAGLKVKQNILDV